MTLSPARTLPRYLHQLAASLLLSLFAGLYSADSQAQPSPEPAQSARELIETNQRAEEILEEKASSRPGAIDSRATPLDALLGLRRALDENDYTRASEYLDMRYLPEGMSELSAENLVKAFAKVWGMQNIVDLSMLSDDPEGTKGDGLPSYREQVGTVSISSGDVPIYLQRIPDGKGGKEWKLSNATVAKIPEMWEELGPSPAAVYLSEILPDFRFMGMDNWQVVATIMLLVICAPVAALASGILMRIALKIPNNFPLGIQRFFKGPMRFYLYIMIVRQLVDQMGLSLTARILLDSSGVSYIAYTVLLLGLLSLARDFQIRKMQHAGNIHYVALLKPFTAIIKVIVVTLIALYWAESAGYNMSTILAGLGVGSVAVALAAQKTLENIIGAATLYVARPVSAGDFCRFGKVTGTVEEIGLRSTLVRTLDRTMVIIPNSVFASIQIENYSHRDRIRYFRQLQLRLLGAEQLRYILAEVRRLLLSHPEIAQETVSARFDNIRDGNALLRVDAGVMTTDFQQYLAVTEDLNLRIVELVHSCGALFAGPGQLMQLQELQTDQDRIAHTEQTLQQWRGKGQLPFPDFSQAQKLAMEDSLAYPPGGSGR